MSLPFNVRIYQARRLIENGWRLTKRVAGWARPFTKIPMPVVALVVFWGTWHEYYPITNAVYWTFAQPVVQAMPGAVAKGVVFAFTPASPAPVPPAKADPQPVREAVKAPQVAVVVREPRPATAAQNPGDAVQVPLAETQKRKPKPRPHKAKRVPAALIPDPEVTFYGPDGSPVEVAQ